MGARDDSSLARLVAERAAAPGRTDTPLAGLALWRACGPDVPLPDADDLCLYAVADGALRLHTPSGIMDYAADQYFVSRIDTPTSGRALDVGDCGALLAVSLELEASEVIEVTLQMTGDLAERVAAGELAEEVRRAADARVIGALARLVGLLDDRVQLAFMGAQLRREVTFHALCGSCGRELLRTVAASASDDIYEANSWIKEHFRDTFSVGELARRQAMSVSTFHQRFKQATGMGPLQRQKRLRLTEARRLMLDEGLGVTEAALAVGYGSASQFTRDYRATYGAAPKADMERLRARLARRDAAAGEKDAEL